MCHSTTQRFTVELALEQGHQVLGYDALTYAGHLETLALFLKTLQTSDVNWVVHFAAESHVDKSITGPGASIETNVNGTFSILSAAKTYFDTLLPSQKTDPSTLVPQGETPRDFDWILGFSSPLLGV
jgi:dTDP-D-glucose 4,6-dehydratase